MTHGGRGIINLQESTNSVTNSLVTTILPKMKGKVGKMHPNRMHIEWFGKRVKRRSPGLDQERVESPSPQLTQHQVTIIRRRKGSNEETPSTWIKLNATSKQRSC